jgi:hypothetical protein
MIVVLQTNLFGKPVGVRKWMELEDINLSEVSLAQKTKNHMFSLICRQSIKGKHNKGIGL